MKPSIETELAHTVENKAIELGLKLEDTFPKPIVGAICKKIAHVHRKDMKVPETGLLAASKVGTRLWHSRLYGSNDSKRIP